MLFPNDEAYSTRTAEFHAVILAGYGNNLDPLVDDDRGVHKAMLPIGNQPMVSYALKWLEEARVQDVLFIAPQSNHAAIHHHLHSQNSAWPSLRIELETVDDEEAESLGPAELLKRFAGHIRSDLIVLPCDFIPPASLPLNSLLNAHRVDIEEPVMTGLFLEVEQGMKDGPDTSLVGIHEKSNTLLFVDAVDQADEINLRMNMLWKFPKMKLTTRLIDSHVYIFRKTVLDLLVEKPDFSSIKEELVPWLCKLQYQPSRRQKYGPTLNPTHHAQDLALQHSTTYTGRHYPHPVVGTHRKPSLSPSSTPFSSQSQNTSPPTESADLPPKLLGPLMDYPIRCNVVVHRLKDGYAARANTLGTYSELNRHCLRTTETVPPTSDMIDPKAQISPDSLIGASTRVAERTTIKKCIIGKHCVIGKNAKISGSVLMDHVEVMEGAKIDNCIISKDSKIGERAQLRDCHLQAGWTVADDAVHKSERLKRFQVYEDED